MYIIFKTKFYIQDKKVMSEPMNILQKIINLNNILMEIMTTTVRTLMILMKISKSKHSFRGKLETKLKLNFFLLNHQLTTVNTEWQYFTHLSNTDPLLSEGIQQLWL